ncbi:DUF1343 domain-containing protein [Isosphaeraceae bacterium EP7]
MVQLAARGRLLALGLCLLALMIPVHARGDLSEVPPGDVGMDAARLALIDGAVNKAIAAGQVPGAVVLVGRHGQLVYAKASGKRATVPAIEAMTRDTAFDLASLTKPVATATSVMILVERGLIRLDESIVRYLPELDNHGKKGITVGHLLRHRSGLTPDNSIADYAGGPAEAWKKIAELPLDAPPGERFAYSDVGFIVLGKLVERVSGRTLDSYARENIFKPLGMADTDFRPTAGPAAAVPATRIAPTEPSGGAAPLRGLVHDPRARKLGGVAGHAGLFSTADDLAAYAGAILGGGQLPGGNRVLGPLSVRAMIDPAATPVGQRRGLGWDVSTPYSSPRGALFGPSSFGHTGFTGTSLWMDPESGVFVIILASRLHPDGKAPSPIALRREVATLAAASIVDGPPLIPTPEPTPDPVVAEAPAPAAEGKRVPVLCGVDVLARDGFAPLKGKRVGLITNHTGRLRDGTPTIDAIFKAPEVKLVALFSPEHGIRGVEDKPIVDDDVDAKTGLHVHSLYGKERKPSPELLKDLDVLVYDIQDIGTRFYTYTSTMGLAMVAAKERGIPLLVLDRPNPIGGLAFDGPVRDDKYESFIAHHALPVRHGMTLGELARLFNVERKIDADLTVIACEGWRRGDLYDRTGLMWVNPSPNMRSLTEALLYPGVGLLEATNLATGRGTDTPFERVGAPYIEPMAFALALNDLGLKGVRFVPIRFTPTERQFSGKECGGVFIAITDWSSFEPLDLFLGMATTLRSTYRDAWEPANLEKFITDEATYRGIVDGKDPATIRAGWKAELEQFAAVRRKALIYP